MNLLHVCSCGNRWSIENDLTAPPSFCPQCGLPAAPATTTGWRALLPRLALAAGATLLLVVVAGVLCIRLLPASRHEPQSSRAEVKEPVPSPPAPIVSSSPPLPDPPLKTTLPLLDAPQSTAPPLDDPPPPRAEKNGVAKPLPPAPAEEFFQHLVVGRVSRYRILELDMGQDVQYVLVSRFRIGKKNEDGSMVVEQKVEGVRLSNADPALQVKLNEMLQKTKGASFTMTLNADREVTKFEGGTQAFKVFDAGNPLGGPSFLLWSFMDRDGWKELAQLSFFQPPNDVRRGQRWDRAMKHSWGPLGAWDGKMHFQATGKQREMERYDYALDLAYRPPTKRGGLPFEIGQSRFQIQAARGAIAYDPKRGRVAAAEERFHVRGMLAVSFAGIDSAVQMDEMQLFQLRIVDKNPLEP